MSTRKQQHYAAIRARAERALKRLYHNATITYPRELYGRTDGYLEQWLQDAAEFEIEYLRDGGSTPGDYRATLAHPANGGKLKSPQGARNPRAQRLGLPRHGDSMSADNPLLGPDQAQFLRDTRALAPLLQARHNHNMNPRHDNQQLNRNDNRSANHEIRFPNI